MRGQLCLLVAIDRTTELAFVALHERATPRVAGGRSSGRMGDPREDGYVASDPQRDGQAVV